MRRVYLVRLSKSKVTLCFASLILTGVLWALGLLDHFVETPFEKFIWPPYIDVKKQVQLELNNEPSTEIPVNDWAQMEPHSLPSCSSNFSLPESFLLIVVKSAAPNIPRRNVIRSTWGAVQTYSGFTIKTIFLVAQLTPIEEKRLGDVLDAENQEFGDLLVGNFYDHYRNNTLKFLTAVGYCNNYCSKKQVVPYALFIDDDYYVSIPLLVNEVRKQKPVNRLYMGWRFDTTPFRFRFSKHRMSLSLYPFDRFPPFISAGAVLLTRQTIKEFYFAIKYVSLINFDDIYTGILAHFLTIPAIHNKRMRFWQQKFKKRDCNEVICAHGFYGDLLLKQHASCVNSS